MNYYKKNPLIKKSIGLVKSAILEAACCEGSCNCYEGSCNCCGGSCSADSSFPLLSVNCSEQKAFQNNNILLACSGGVDSLALAYSLKFVSLTSKEIEKISGSFAESKDKKHINIFVAIIDHGVQKNSSEVCKKAKEELLKIGYIEDQIFIEKIDESSKKSDNKQPASEDNLRYLRYKKLEEIADRCRAKFVLTAHTLDDVAENIFLGLARGSGAKSLNGISKQNGRILRPFLELTRQETTEICEFAGVDYWQDPTNGTENNTDESFPLRSRIRNEIMPVLKNVLGDKINLSLSRTAYLLQQDDKYFDSLVDEFICKNALDSELNPIFSGETCHNAEPSKNEIKKIVIEISKLEELDFAVRTRVIKKVCELLVGYSERGISMNHISAIDSLIVDWHGQKDVSIPAVTVYRKTKERLMIFEKN